MKILTKEEEQAHYNATLKGGITGGAIGLGLGAAVVYGANARFHTFRQLTLPLKTFLATSSGTFAAIISADRASRSFELDRNPERREIEDRSAAALEEARAQKSTFQRAKEWGKENRYPIVGVSWVASMAIALGLVGRNPYLSGAQKLVQARVYAQGLTLAVLVATAAFEAGDAHKGEGRWETVQVLDPNDPTHKHMIEKKIHHEAYAGEDLWRDMVASEERKIEERKRAVKDKEAEEKKARGSKEHNISDHEAKNKIVSEHKSAGKIDRKEAEANESKNMEAQKKKEGDAQKEARAPVPKNSDRNQYDEK